MKIDIHIHTKRIKSGDAETREIEPNAFCDIISKTDVKICAITNHNHFDKSQYDSILEQSQSSFQTWPGVGVCQASCRLNQIYFLVIIFFKIHI